MQQAQINAPSNAAARVPAATNNSSHTGAAKPAVAPHQFLKDPAAEEPVETGSQRHLPQEAWSVMQQKKGQVQPALQKKENIGANVLQRKTNNLLQRPWASNYEESGLTVEGVFSDDDIKRGYVINDENKGTVAHELIQKANGSWIPEYGIPPAVEGGGWSYADMVKNKEIYEIKPEHGGEDAVVEATKRVDLANAIDPGHKLATADIIRDTGPLLTKELTVINSVTRMNENDTYTLRLNYWKSRAGEILYRWVIKNTSAEERKAERSRDKGKRKREEKKKEKQKEESAKVQKGQKFTIAEAFAKKKPAAEKASSVAESPSATAEPTEAPEAEEQEQAEEEEAPE